MCIQLSWRREGEGGESERARWSRDKLLRRGGAVKDLKGPDKHKCFSRIIHLAKLNPNCHMNYLDYL